MIGAREARGGWEGPKAMGSSPLPLQCVTKDRHRGHNLELVRNEDC